MTDKQKRTWAWVGVGVVVVAILIAIFWRPSGQTPGSQSPQPVYAPQGQLVAQFPTNLILDSNAAVTGSYSINYSSSTNQYTAEFNSSSSMQTLYAKYKNYLTTNGWTITNDMSEYSSSRGLYANNASSEVSVAIVAQGAGSNVTVGYLEQ